MLTAIIVDDENDGVETLSRIVNDFCKEVKVVGTANSAIEAIKLINSQNPDIIFLDIEMPGGNGFDIIEATPNKNYHVIFTTAYNHYAIQAIKANAIDYLMKPIDIDELIEAVEKVKLITNESKKLLQQNLTESIKSGINSKLPIANNNEYILVDYSDILYFESKGSYCCIHTNDGQYVASKNLKKYGEILPESFIRVSNSHIVNMDNISKYIKEDGGIILMNNGDEIIISKRRKDEIKSILGI